jgi:hypothetical protein
MFDPVEVWHKVGKIGIGFGGFGKILTVLGEYGHIG